MPITATADAGRAQAIGQHMPVGSTATDELYAELYTTDRDGRGS